MRRAPRTPVVSGTLYRNVAMLIVGLALLAALFGGRHQPEPPVAEPAKRAIGSSSEATFRSAEPAQLVGAAGEAPDANQSGGEEASHPPQQPAGEVPPDGAPRAANPARPTPAQLAHLIEQSRLRSGANPGGD